MATVVASNIPDCSIKPLPAPSVYAYEANNGNYRALFKASLDEVDTVRFESHGGHICWQPTEFGYEDAAGNIDPILAVSDVPISVEGNIAQYDRSSPDIDEQWTVEEARLKHVWVLRQPLRAPAPWIQLASAYLSCGGYLEVAADHKLFVGGQEMLGSFETAGAIEIRNAANELVMTLARVSVKDAAGQATSGKYRVSVQPDGSRLLSVLVDYAWLQVAAYPVEIDPTVTTNTQPSNPYLIGGASMSGGRFSDGRLFYVGADRRIYTSADNGQTWAMSLELSPRAGNFYHPQVIQVSDTLYISGAETVWNGSTYDWTLRFYRITYSTGTRTLTQSASSYHGLFSGSTGYLGGHALGRFASNGKLVMTYYWSNWTQYYWTYSTDNGATWSGAVGVETGFFDACAMFARSSSELVLAGISGSTLKAFVIPDTATTAISTYYTFAADGTRGPALFWDSTNLRVGAVVFNDAGVLYRYHFSGTAWASSGAAVSVGEPPGIYVKTSVVIANGGKRYTFYTTGTGYRKLRSLENEANDTLEYTHTADVSNGSIVAAPRNTNPSDLVLVYITDNLNQIYAAIKTFNTAPSAPTNLVPGGGTAFDATASQNFTWQFNDSDPSDGQSAYELEVYNNATDALLQSIAKTASTQAKHTFAANTFTNGLELKWRVRTYDLAGVVSPWSDYAIARTSATPTVTLTAPAAGTINTTTPVTEHVYSQAQGSPQASFGRRVRSTAGTVLHDSGELLGTGTKYQIPSGIMANGTSYDIEAYAKSQDGITGTSALTRVTVSLTPPPAPTIVLTPDPVTAGISVAITNPAPGTGVPDASYNRVYRRKVGELTWRLMADNVAKNGTWSDYSPASGQAYEYGVAPIGDNGVEGSIVSAQAAVTFDGWWLVDEANPANNVKFRYNVDQVPVGVDEARAEFKTFGKYPIVQYGAGRAKRGSLSGLVVDETTTAKDQADKVDALAALRKSLLLKGWRGHIWRVNIHNLSRNIVRDLVIKSEQVQVAWVEVGDV